MNLTHVSPAAAGRDLPGEAGGSSARDLLKGALCGLYRYSGAMQAQERLAYWSGRRFMSVLLLHRVTDDIPADGLTVGTAYFRRLCALLARRFHVVPLGEVVRRLRSGTDAPPRTVAITFDDCYHNNLDAARILAEHGLPACFFVPTQFIGTDHVFPWDRGLKPLANLDWDDLHEMLRLGHEIGSHTVSHADLGAVGADDVRRELVESKKTLEARLGRPIRWFAYPFGGRDHFRAADLRLVYEAGYEACFSGFGGSVRHGMAGTILPREPVPYFRSLLNFELHLAGCLQWYYALKRCAGGPAAS